MAWAHNPNEILFIVTGQNNFRKTRQEVEQDLTGMQRAVQNLGTGLKFAATATVLGVGIQQLVQAGAELTQLGANFMRIQTSYHELVKSMNMDGDTLLEGMRRVSLGTISDMELMRTANIASLLSVAVSEQQLTGLLQVAAARGRALGLSTQDAFERIATGIGRLSPKILDDLGILIGGQTAFTKYAESVGKSLLELTDMEKRQFLVNRVLQEAKPLADDAASSIERLGAAFTNYRAQQGTAAMNLLDSFGFLTGLTDFLNQQVQQKTISNYMTEFYKSLEVPADLVRGMGAKSMDEMGVAMTLLVNNADQVTQRWLANEMSAEQAKEALDALKAEYIAATPALQQQAAAAEAASQATDQITAATTQLQAAIASTLPSISTMRYNLGSLGNMAGYASDQLRGIPSALAGLSGEFASAQERVKSIAMGLIPEVGLEGAREYADQWAKRIETIQYTATNKLVRGYVEGTTVGQDFADAQEDVSWAIADAVSGMQEEADGIRNLNREMGSATKTTSEYDKSLEKLKGTIDSVIGSVISGTSSLTSWDPFDFVSNPDGPARDFGRMWDVAVNGFKSQWLDELRAQGLIPDDVVNQGEEALKRFAEAKARAFQKGTDLSLMDKGQLKQLVLDQIAAEEAMAALRDQIFNEIVGGGVSKKKATAAIDTVLGTDMQASGAAGAVTYGEGFVGSMSGQGAKIAATLAIEIEANKTGFQGAGRAAGVIWGDAFLNIVGDNVPPELVLLLVSLVTPGVIERIAKDQKRSEPAK